jgi:autotransporter-associated beta strand protein
VLIAPLSVNTVTNAGKVLYIVAKSNNVVLGGSIATNNAANNNLALFLTNSAGKTLTLTASNAFRRGVTIESGILEAAHPASLGNGGVNLAPTVPDGAILKVSYDGSGGVLGNLLLQNDAIIDAGSSPASSISFATATNWTAGKILTVSNSTVGRIYITNTNDVPLDHIKSAEFPTYSASLDSAGLLEFLPPPPSGTTYVGWLASAGARATPESLFEYAYGAPVPGSADSQYSPAMTVRGEMLVLTYHVRQGAIGLTVSPEVSVALDGPGAGFGPSVLLTDVSTGPVLANGVLLDRREASIPISIFGAKAFLRVVVAQE